MAKIEFNQAQTLVVFEKLFEKFNEAGADAAGKIDVQDIEFQVLSPRLGIFLENSLRLGLTLGDFSSEDPASFPVGLSDRLNKLVSEVDFDPDVEGSNFTVIADLVANEDIAGLQALNDKLVDQANQDLQDEQTNLFSAIVMNDATVPLGPGVFCVADNQCKGERGEKFQKRECIGLGDADRVNFCNDFVAFFTIRWLWVWIALTYGIFILWAIYWIVPWIRRKIRGKKKKQANAGPTVGEDQGQQIIINTLATQCASAENMLFQATDMLKQAKAMKAILAVEAKRESRLMILTVELFQAVSAILVSLTHQYMKRKAFAPGEKYNTSDPAVRALQLEILNYVRERLQLAFQADPMTEKSLLRIAEAYAILKKVSDALVIVGFSNDMEADEGYGSLRTPLVELTEDAFFLSGTYMPPNAAPGQQNYAGQTVCVVIENSDTRNANPMQANVYLANSQRESKVFDAQMGMVKKGEIGMALAYNPVNQGVDGGSQYFVRTFWGNEISLMQREAETWLRDANALENFLERERLERESKAAPVVKRGAKKKRKKKKKKKDKYVDESEEKTQITEYTEATGWSIDSSNTYVYNYECVVKQGLGVAGQPGLPYDKPREEATKQGSRFYRLFESYFPNYAEWPKFYTFIFIIMPIIIAAPMLAKARKGSTEIDIDGNVGFKARPAGFGISFLGVPAYYFLDGDVPELEDLVGLGDVNADPVVNNVTDLLEVVAERNLDIVDGEVQSQFDNLNQLFISNEDAERFFREDFNGAFGRVPDVFLAEIQAGILNQEDVDGLDSIRDMQLKQEVTTVWIYALMHIAAYFFGMIPLTLVRESLELLARRFPIIRDIYPMSLWRELHMSMGLAGILFVAFGATVFLITSLVAMGRATPFAGLAGDPNIPIFFDLIANVLFIRQYLLPCVPLLLLMKYASRGPPVWMRKYAPNVITKNYWEICYFLHYFTALTAIITLVIYRPQVFYWMGATWGFVWGGNKILRILRTRKCTIKKAQLVSYKIANKRDNSSKKSNVLRIQLNVPPSFPSSSRGQACWLTVPNIDYIAHPFTLAKVPTDTDKSIMFHIAVKYLAGDDILTYARPAQKSQKKIEPPPPRADPNALPPGWKEAVDPESGQTYYYNSAEGKTQWDFPVQNTADRVMDGFRGLTSRISANLLRSPSARFGAVGLGGGTVGDNPSKIYSVASRATWTQKFAELANKLETMDADLRRNAVKGFPVYVSAPLGTSMDDCLQPNLAGSIIITTQNGLPAAESSVRWLLMQGKLKRPKFHFFVSVSREVNDALSVVETLRDALCDSVVAGHLNIEGLNGGIAHMVDWLGVYIHLTRRKPSQIQGDREMLMRALNPPAAPVTNQQLEMINAFIMNRVQPGRLPFDRFLTRTQQMVMKRTGARRMAVGYCGSAKVAYSIRSACRNLKEVKFDGEYI